MRVSTTILVSALLLFARNGTNSSVFAQDARTSTDAGSELLGRVIANQKKNEEALRTYERIERVEVHKGPENQPPEVKIARVVPAGTGMDRIPVGPDGKPSDIAAYRAELEKLVRSLTWASEDGRSQREAYEKALKREKERDDLIDATRAALIYTFVDREPRGDRLLAKYRMEPNPEYRPTTRGAAIFSKVHGFVWIDESAGEMARVEGHISEDVSFGGFLAKVYKGSHFMQERWEVAPGVWLPTFSQYDFDGRKLFSSFAFHERTFYSQYRHIGPPKEALPTIRAEMDKLSAAAADP